MCSLAVQMVYSLATVLIHPLAGGYIGRVILGVFIQLIHLIVGRDIALRRP